MKKKLILVALLVLMPLSVWAQVRLNPDGTQVPQSPHTPETTRNQAPYPVEPSPVKRQSPPEPQATDEDEYVDIRPFYRIAGTDRYDTASRITNEVFLRAEDIIMISGEGLAESVCAMPLAGKLGAPILLTDGLTLDDQTRMEIQRLKPKRITLLGLEGSFSGDLEEALQKLGAQTFAITAEDPVALSLKLNAYLHEIHALQRGTCALVNAQNPLDAIALMPVLARTGMAVYLLPEGLLSPQIEEALEAYSEIWIAGGEESVPSQTEAKLLEMGLSLERFAGKDRVETSLQIAQRFYHLTDSVIVANAERPADALTAFSLCLNRSGPLLLVYEQGFSEDLLAYLNRQSFRKIYLLGGYEVFPPEMDDQLKAYLKP